MKIKLAGFYRIFLFLFCLAIPFSAMAVAIQNPLQFDTIQELIDTVITIIFIAALAIAPILYIIAGFYYLTSYGEMEKIEKAKKIILYTTIGLIIILSARGIMELFNIFFLQ